MKLVALTVFLLFYTCVLLGNSPTPNNASQNSSTHTDGHQAPADQAPTAKDKIDSGHNTKPDQPEASPNQQPHPSVTINAVPRIDVKRDWMDRGTLIVGILLVIVGAVTGGLIWYQSVQTKIAAQAGRDSAKAALLNAQAVINSERPWIVVTVTPDKERKRFLFEATNQGRTPAKIISGEIGHEFTSDPMKIPSPPTYKATPTPRSLLAATKSVPIYRIEPEWWAINNKDSAGQGFWDSTISLVVFGRIRYLDLINRTDKPEIHQTCWCFTYVLKEMRFVEDGPEEYNRHT